MNIIEVVLFVTAVVGVIALGIWKSRDEDIEGEEGATDYFLAGRGLTWWLVGFSLIAANISTEQFVGMSGSAADWLGMAIASYEWMAAVTLVLVGFFFLPRFLRAGLYTIPEFLEYRFNGVARLAMAIPAIVTLVFVTTSSVIYSGGKFVSEYYNTVREIRDLLWQPDQINPLLEQLADQIRPLEQADLDRWNGGSRDDGRYIGLSGVGSLIPGLTRDSRQSESGIVIDCFWWKKGEWYLNSPISLNDSPGWAINPELDIGSAVIQGDDYAIIAMLVSLVKCHQAVVLI